MRKDVDNISIGDILILAEYLGLEDTDPYTSFKEIERFTGKFLIREVKYILRNYEGLQPNYCIIGF